MVDMCVREGRNTINSCNNQVSLSKERNKDQRKDERFSEKVRYKLSQVFFKVEEEGASKNKSSHLQSLIYFQSSHQNSDSRWLQS